MRAIRPRTLIAAAIFIALSVALAPASASNADPCTAPANVVVAENCRADGVTPYNIWNVPVASTALQGYTARMSVDQGERVDLKVDTTAPTYRIDIYRLGYYGANGARRVARLPAHAGKNQPDCPAQAGTGLVECNWATTDSWSTAGQASGVYVAHLVSGDETQESHVPFVVRDDDGHSDVLFQTSDTTWQAYNRYGGKSLYYPSTAARAFKVSYDRPFTTRKDGPEDFLFNAEYPMIRWLERNGYDVSYTTGVDTDMRGAELREHKVFLSVGHDEYWSGAQRANVEAARDAGVNLGFFSGNEVFWKTRWEDDHRTLVTYKETHDDAVDPTDVWTGTWRDPRAKNPEGGRPENALTGTIFTVNEGTRTIEVPAADGKLRLWRGTAAAGQAPGAAMPLASDTLGYEWDEDLDNGARPAGLVRLSTTAADNIQKLQDFGSTYATGSAVHHLTLDRDTNGPARDALVFGAGTVQWSWGLDNMHDRGNGAASPVMQQATVNLLADMNVQPATLQLDLQAAAPSADRTPATAALSGPATRHVDAGVPVTISGSASDAGGGRVGAVEVSTDGGATWHPADGRETWTYTWRPAASGTVTPLVRAADDSGNLTGDVPDAVAGGGPGGNGPGSGSGKRRRVRLRPARPRMTRAGVVRLRLSCPRGRRACRTHVVLRRNGRRLAAAERRVPAGATRHLTFRLGRKARAKVLRRGSLRVTAVARIRRGAATTTRRVPIRILAPGTKR